MNAGGEFLGLWLFIGFTAAVLPAAMWIDRRWL
jgi:hypothetical protein